MFLQNINILSYIILFCSLVFPDSWTILNINLDNVVTMNDTFNYMYRLVNDILNHDLFRLIPTALAMTQYVSLKAKIFEW